MKNPNEIHSVDILRNWQKNPDKIKTKKVIIYQVSSTHQVSPLYTIYPIEHLISDASQFHVDVTISGTIKAHFIRHIPEPEMDKFIADLQLHFKRGRYLFKDSLHRLPNAMTKHLTYKQIKKILTWERNASRFLSEQHMAIQMSNPVFIKTYIDCGKYFLEVFNRNDSGRPQYAYSTFDVKTEKWLNQIIL